MPNYITEPVIVRIPGNNHALTLLRTILKNIYDEYIQGFLECFCFTWNHRSCWLHI